MGRPGEAEKPSLTRPEPGQIVASATDRADRWNGGRRTAAIGWSYGVPILVCLVLASIILAYAGLIGIGHWQGDEFVLFASYRQYGIATLYRRIFGWAPRPVSELLLWLYGSVVNHDHQPHIAPFLAFLWGLVIAAGIMPTISRDLLRPDRILYRFLLGLSVLTMLLLGHEINQLFYWPVGAATYLTTLAALIWGLFLLIDDPVDSPRRRIVQAVALSLAAGSSEVGAIFTVCFSGIRFFGISGDLPLLKSKGRLARVFPLLIPLAISLAVLAGVVLSRVGRDHLADSDARFLHHPMTDMLVATPELFREFMLLNGSDRLSIGLVVEALLVRGLFFIGFRGCCESARIGEKLARQALDFAIAAFATAEILIAATLYEFGFLCCERHVGFRQGLFVVGLAALAIWSAGRQQSVMRSRLLVKLAPVLLLLAALMPFSFGGFSGLSHDYRLYGLTLAARARNWRAGLNSAASTMIYWNAPDGRVVHGEQLPSGHYVLTTTSKLWAKGMMRYFHKRAIDIKTVRVSK